MTIDWTNLAPQAFLTFGLGCSLGYSFAMRTAVRHYKDQLEQERKIFEQRLNDERRSCDKLVETLKANLSSTP